MSRVQQTITIAVSEKLKIRLEQIAAEQGCMWGDKPNISELIRRIAEGEIPVGSAAIQAAATQLATAIKTINSI